MRPPLRTTDCAIAILIGLTVGVSFMVTYLSPHLNVMTRSLTAFVRSFTFWGKRPQAACLIIAIGGFAMAALFTIVCILKGVW
jgi:hypothetical protein